MKYIILIASLLLLLLGCELLNQAPLTITGHSPESTTLASPDNVAVWVRFSTSELDKTSIEQAFSFSEGSTPMEGTYSWSGERLAFVPLKALNMGKFYTMRVASSAEDKYGNNLKGEFSFTFRIGNDTERPVIVDVNPAEGLEVVDQFYPIVITFSEPVDQASFYDAFSLSPAVTASYTWNETNPNAPTCTVTPHEAYKWQTDYTITISEDLKDLAGNFLGDVFTSRFSVGQDHDPPVYTVRYNDGGVGVTLPPNVTVPGWEASWPITIDFLEPVLEPDSSFFQFTPSISFTLDWDFTNRNKVVITPKDRWVWGTMYTLSVKKGITDLEGNATTDASIHRFTVEGLGTRPPKVTKVYCTETSDDTSQVFNRPLVMWDIIFTGTSNPIPDWNQPALDYFFDFYIQHANGAEITEIYFMEYFDIDDSGCITIEVQRVETFGIDLTGPMPIEPPAADEILIRVHCNINNTNPPGTGLIDLNLKSGFTDSLGNPIAQAYKLSLNKP